MNTANVIRNRRNLMTKITAVTSIATLLVVSSGFTLINGPAQAFDGPGYTYTIEYQCGTQTTDNDPQAQPGEYSTNILVHNPFTEPQKVFVKILPARGFPADSQWVDSNDESKTPYAKSKTVDPYAKSKTVDPYAKSKTVDPFTIGPNGALEIDCAEITTVAWDANQLDSVFSKGLVVISHPIPLDDTQTLVEQPLFGDESLDVTAAYTFKGTVEIKHFNKVLVKKKVLTPSTGAVTSTISELLIPAANGTLSSTTTFDIKAAINNELSCSVANTVCEVISIHYGIINEGESGNSKHVETIKGKFVPFVPVPEPEPSADEPPKEKPPKEKPPVESCDYTKYAEKPNPCEYLFYPRSYEQYR